MHGVYDRTGSDGRLLGAPARVAFRISPTASAPGTFRFRGSIPSLHFPLSTLRRLPHGLPTHDSGPSWLATPSTYGSLIRYSLPVIRRFQGFRQAHE
jgi:hypothetical protein